MTTFLLMFLTLCMFLYIFFRIYATISITIQFKKVIKDNKDYLMNVISKYQYSHNKYIILTKEDSIAIFKLFTNFSKILLFWFNSKTLYDSIPYNFKYLFKIKNKTILYDFELDDIKKLIENDSR